MASTSAAHAHPAMAPAQWRSAHPAQRQLAISEGARLRLIRGTARRGTRSVQVACHKPWAEQTRHASFAPDRACARVRNVLRRNAAPHPGARTRRPGDNAQPDAVGFVSEVWNSGGAALFIDLFIANCFPFASIVLDGIWMVLRALLVVLFLTTRAGKGEAVRDEESSSLEFRTSDTKPTRAHSYHLLRFGSSRAAHTRRQDPARPGGAAASGCALSSGRRDLAPGCGAALRRSTLRTRAHARSGAKEACLVCSAQGLWQATCTDLVPRRTVPLISRNRAPSLIAS